MAAPAALGASPMHDWPWALASAAGGGLALLLLASARARWLSWLGSLFTRLRQDRILDHPVRARLQAAVAAEPGIHLRGLMRAVGRGEGVVRHHLDALVAAGLVHVLEGPGLLRCFPAGCDPDVMQALAVLRKPAARRALAAVVAQPGITLQRLADASGLPYAQASRVAMRLKDARLVTSRRAGRLLRFAATGAGLRLAGAPAMGSAIPNPLASAGQPAVAGPGHPG